MLGLAHGGKICPDVQSYPLVYSQTWVFYRLLLVWGWGGEILEELTKTPDKAAVSEKGSGIARQFICQIPVVKKSRFLTPSAVAGTAVLGHRVMPRWAPSSPREATAPVEQGLLLPGDVNGWKQAVRPVAGLLSDRRSVLFRPRVRAKLNRPDVLEEQVG